MLNKMEPQNESLTTDEVPKQVSVGLILARGGAQLTLMLLVLGVGLAGMTWLVTNKDEPPKRPPFKTVYTVNTVIVEKGSFQPRLIVYGEIQASRSVELRSLVAGQVISIHPELKAGSRITKGQPLFQINPFNYEVAVSEAKANMQETRARLAENEARIAIETTKIERLQEQLELANSDLKRIEELRENGTATAKQVDDRSLIVSQRRQALQQSELMLVAEQAKLQQQEAILERFKWRIQQAERDLEDTVLSAPFSGVISENNAQVGRMIGANDLVVSMYEADKLEVRFTLTDQRFGRIQSDKTGIVGRKVEVIWIVGGEEYRFPAVIERIGAQIASNRGGVEVIASIETNVKESPLRPGAFVEIIVPDKAFGNHFRIPETAVYSNNIVYVVVDSRLVKRQIKIDARDGDQVIVSGDISQDEEILVTRIAEISEGIRVRTNQTSQEQGSSQEGSTAKAADTKG